MITITSKQNNLIKHCALYKDKKFRKRDFKALVEGENSIVEAIKCGYKVDMLFFVEKCKNFSNSISVNENNKVLVNDEVLKHISSTVTPQGIVAIIDTNKDFGLFDGQNFVVLDNLQDPQNMGAIIRTAVATGVSNIFSINCVDFFNDKVIRSSAGNVFKAKLYSVNYEQIKYLINEQVNLFCADMNGKNIFELKNINSPYGIVIGNEGNGISDAMKNMCTNSISIPMKNDVESLNANVSAAIILYYLSSFNKK